MSTPFCLSRVAPEIRLFAAAAMLSAAACAGGTEPASGPLDLRTDPHETATVWGYVFTAPGQGASPNQKLSEFRESPPGVTVELGRWEGPVIDWNYCRVPHDPTAPSWARLSVMARDRTDANGRYQFAGVPRNEVVSVMVQGSVWPYATPTRYRAVAMEPIFWLANTTEHQEDLFVWDMSR